MPFIGPKPADTVLDSTLIGDGTRKGLISGVVGGQ